MKRLNILKPMLIASCTVAIAPIVSACSYTETNQKLIRLGEITGVAAYNVATPYRVVKDKTYTYTGVTLNSETDFVFLTLSASTSLPIGISSIKINNEECSLVDANYKIPSGIEAGEVTIEVIYTSSAEACITNAEFWTIN